MNSARDAYDAFAPIYDRFNATNDYEMWLGEALLPELEKHGLRGDRVLDVGCGTGRAFEPLLKRGWDVTGCDLSKGMLDEATKKYGDAVPLQVADARDLPRIGRFDLVLCLNDVVNYFTEDGDLERAFAGMRANLFSGGLLLFDANTLSLMEANFAQGDSGWMSVGDWKWVGRHNSVEPGGTYEAKVSGRGVEAHVHRERHWTREQIVAALEAAGLEFVTALGQDEVDHVVVLTDPPDEKRDHKTIYIARAR